ncbi:MULTISPECIES: tyrosine-type recombinase/integrase [unclassified Granulicatella]|uniref:tyrosine-type recombinase/integrase n=1 Tax=unclassified Granulicatella TaxID=2630493 RepID=UPI001074761A|nr:MULTISPECIES: tyrosine-type recombinase/integrase [unclassified Granulicatella]MBF0780549.1 tyrosine-type recombinase/integrase [Granulicatella sp. 19428wC4_WM01]TFU94903.1 hypothetical protein E4T68_05510 [Granulicatella sp. WM01]
MQKACKRANIKAITFHALRHTHGSILLYKGSSILYIKTTWSFINCYYTTGIFTFNR